MRLAKHSLRLRSLLTLGPVLGLVGCFTLADYPAAPLPPVGTPDADGTRRLYHEGIANGRFSPLGDVAFAIHEWDEWAAIKRSLRIPWDLEPDLDRSTVIYVAAPAASTADYRVRVDSVYAEGGLLSERRARRHLVGGKIVVAYTVEEPGDDCPRYYDQAMPYEVVVVGATFDREIVLREAREAYACSNAP